MEVCAKLESFLEENELNNISETAKDKILDHINGLHVTIKDLQNDKLELQTTLEQQQFEFEKEVAATHQQLEESTESVTKLKLQIADLEESLSSVQKQWRDLQKLHDSSMLEFQTTKRENDLLTQEKKNLAEQLEKRRTEIEKLNGEMKNLLEQTTAANEAKYEAIAAAEDAKMKESNLQHQVTRLEQERDLLNRQITDLNAEVSQKNHQIHTLTREKSNTLLDLQTKLEDRVDRIQLLQKKLCSFKENLDEKDRRIVVLAGKIRQLSESHSKAEEQFSLELSAQAKLIELHKKASEDNQKRVQELMRAFEEAQKLLKQSNESCEETEKRCQEVENKCRVQLEEKKNEVFLLRDELRKAKEMALGVDKDALEKVFPIAAATSKVLHSGMTLTELYVEYTKLQEQLQQEKTNTANLTQELKQIVTEIEEKTPLINQRMNEYEKSKETISCLKSQLANALVDYEKMLQERNDAKRIGNATERERNRLKTQVQDLNRQVQILLKEVEEARGRSVPRGSSKMNEDLVTSSDDVTADKVISRHLVTFRDIEEIQSKNQKLLAVIRDLSQQHEEMEKKLSTELTEKFQKDIDALSTQLEDLQQKRIKQNEMLETIIRQRDMYRVLLTSHGVSESLLGQPEGSLSMLQSPKLALGDPRLKEAKSALHQLQAEFDNYKKEKNENERMLNEQLDKMRNELSDLRIQNAKLASQSEYSEERVKMLQTNLDTYEKECTSFKDKSKQHSTLIVQHQQTINSLRQDLMLAQEKIAKSDVTIENLKAERDLLKNVEARLLQEKDSVVKEQQQQSRLMANLQAVQNNLERMESESKRNLQYQVEKLEKENAILKTKVDNANEEYRAAVKIWEKQNRELQTKIDAEVERNRKLHEDLVDAYSQVHGLNQQLINAKTQISSTTPEKVESEKTPKTLQKTSQSPANATVAEIKQLKEQLNEAQMKLKSLQEKLDITTKSSEQYLSMCRDLEIRVKEQDEINKQLKNSMDSALNSSKQAQTSLEKNLEDMEKTNRELLEENMKITQNSGSQVSELQTKVNELAKTIDSYKNQAEEAKKVADQARTDCQNQMRLMKEVQEKYERELMLHAQDMQTLTTLKEEHQHCTEKFEKLTEVAKIAEQTLAESRESWSRQENMLTTEIKALQERFKDLEQCNRDLHDQLEMMGTQMAALNSKNWDETPYASIQSDLKDTHHLLQVIQFIKKEKEIASSQYDMVKSENVRLNIKLEQLTSELNETKSELKEMMGNFQAKAASDAQHADLLKKVEMLNLLTESNNLLRLEKEALTTSKSEIEARLHEVQQRLQPLIEKEREISQQNDVLAAENNALRVEVKNWQSRTNQLLEQSHRIGPQEYKNLMKDIEELKVQKERLTEELQKKQAEVSQLTAIMNGLKKEVEILKKSQNQKTQEITKLKEDSAEHQKTLLQVRKIGRKYKMQFDELTVKYNVLLAKSNSSETVNQEQALQELQKKLDESEKREKELANELQSQKESANLAKEAQTKSAEKETKALKFLSQLKERFANISSQKDTVAEENEKLKLQVETLKFDIATLNVSQAENNKNRKRLEDTVARLEKELKTERELRANEREIFEKKWDELQKKQLSKIKPSIGIAERASGSGAEPLTANIKPLTSPSTSGVGPSLRISSHPHAATSVSRPTPTASIRPMAIGTATPSTPCQARMATVLPTTATPPHSEDAPTSAVVSLPHAVQPLVQISPATATVAPTTMAVTVTPVISAVTTNESANFEDHQSETPQAHVIGVQVVPTPATALVTPRIDVTEVPPLEPPAADSPAPTTSVIVSPPATQVVTPTLKRAREESPGPVDLQESSLKRVRMVSEGSQTNQHLSASSGSAGTSNIAVVSASAVAPRTKTPEAAIEPETHTPVQSVPVEPKDTPVAIISSSQPSTSDSVDESVVPTAEVVEAEILEDDEKEEQNIEWETQEEVKIDEYEIEVMEQEVLIVDENDELEEDVEQMQGIDGKSPDDQDMAEEQQEEEMTDQSIPVVADIEIPDSSSDIQMEGDSSSLQAAPSGSCMAPPAFPPTLEVATNVDVPPVLEVNVVPAIIPPAPVLPQPVPVGPPRLDRQAPAPRSHLTPFTIPGQGSNFEEGDDSIVPSTPTLYVPRRTDGFAEAVSSPHVPQVRFLFSSSDGSPTQQSYSSQLASQGALGVDDTRMDLFDEGSNRIVPSTPLQTSPPVEVALREVPESSIINVPLSETATTVETKIESGPDTSIIIPSITITEAVASPAEPDKTQTENVGIKTDTKTVQHAAEPVSAIPESSPGSSSEVPVLEKSMKSDETQESGNSSKDDPTPAASQRKPIVWSKAESSEPPCTLDVPSSTPPPTSTSTVLRGRGTARRSPRYAVSSSISRGRGNTTWVRYRGRSRGRNAY